MCFWAERARFSFFFLGCFHVLDRRVFTLNPVAQNRSDLGQHLCVHSGEVEVLCVWSECKDGSPLMSEAGRTPQRGGNRKFRGFDEDEWGEVPKTPSRTTSWMIKRTTPIEGNDGVDFVRESDFKERRGGRCVKRKVLLRARAGAPSKDPVPHTKRNVLLSQKAYERLRAGRERAERRLAQIKLEQHVARKEKRAAKLGRSTKTVSERAALHARPKECLLVEFHS